MKTTVFTKYHIAAGARMAEFAGYNMPIEFTGINDEHMAVREGAGVFDVSHMGEIWVKGPQAFALLQHITSNDVAKLYDGKVQYTCMPNGRGGIVDDVLVYRIDAETYMLCVNAPTSRRTGTTSVKRAGPSAWRPAAASSSTTPRTRSASWPCRDRWP